MNKIVRFGLFAVGGLLLLIALALAYIFFMFDPNTLKPQIEKLVSEKTERQLKLDGQINLRIWPAIGASIDKASWSEYRSQKNFVELGHIQINLAFWPLLKQRYVVQELDIDGLKGALIRNADGTLSIADLIKPQPKKEETTSSAPVEFAVDKVRIHNASFSFDDRQQNRISSIDKLDISADNIGKEGMDKLAIAAEISNSVPLVKVKLALKAKEIRLPANQPIALQGLEFQTSGTLPEGMEIQNLLLTLEKASIKPDGLSSLDNLALDGQVSAKQGKLSALKLNLPKAALQLKGESRLDNLSLLAEGEASGFKAIKVDFKTSARGQLDNNTFHFDQLKLIASAQHLQQALSATVNTPSLSYQNKQLASPQLAASAAVKAPNQAVDVKLQLANVKANLDNKTSMHLKAQGTAQQGQESVNFNLDSPVLASLQPLTFDLPALKLALNLKTPKLKTGGAALNVAGSANAQLDNQQAGLKLNGQFDGSKGHVNATVSNFKQPDINFDVALDQLNLDRYLAASAPAAAAPAPATKQAPAKIDLSPLAPLKLDGKLAIGKITKDKLQASNLAVSVKAGNGLISVPSLTVKAFEGSLAGSLSATTTSNPSFSIKQTLTSVDIGQVLATFADFHKLSGHGNATVDVNATGNLVDTLKKTAKGTITAKMTDGAWKGINIGKSIREAKSFLAGGTKTQQAVTTEQTDFSELSASIKLADGIASNDDLSAKSPLFRIAGKGQANLVAENVDYLVLASVVSTSQGQGGQDLDKLKGMTVPIRVKGPFAKLSYGLDFNAMLKDSTKAKLEEQKKALESEVKTQLDVQKTKAEDKLKNELKKGLGGLFK